MSELNEKQKNEKKISVSIDEQDLREIDLLVSVGATDSRDSFIKDAITEKKTEIMQRIKNAVGKKAK